jgi:GT2 family glycosyltransferase
MNFIATLLTVHNRKEKTLICLAALFNCPLPENYQIDVYLVDDGSMDGTSEAIKVQFSQVNIIQGNGNLFWNRGMHLAWQTAAKTKDYDYYLWLNDDTVLYEHAVKDLVKFAENTHAESIIVGTCISSENSLTYGGYSSKDIHRVIKPNGMLQECYFFNGNIVLIPHTVFDKTGNLDKYFRHSFGDYDYGMRALKKGIKSYVAPEIIACCNSNAKPFWLNTDNKLSKRIKYLYSPLGVSPIEHFYYARRHWGLSKAVSTFISIHIRTIFPQ